jgi:translocation protein SEC62
MTVWDKTYEPLMKLVLHKKGVPTRSAAEVGKKVVTIFRGKDFVEFLTNHYSDVARRCPELMKSLGSSGTSSLSVEDIKKLGDNLLEKGFVARAVAKELKVAPKEDESPESKKTEKKKKKWPEKIIRLVDEYQFEPSSVYIVLYEGDKTIQHVFSAIAIVLVLVACMFPAWPAWAKIGAWYVVFSLSTAMFVILIVRMVLYVCLWTVGIDFWLFPNILDEYAGIVDSFRPLYTVEKRRDGYFMLVVRVLAMVIIYLATSEFAKHNSWEDIKNFARNSVNDILDWGIDKLTALPQPKQQYLSLADIEKMAEEAENPRPTTIPPEIVEEEIDIGYDEEF